MPFFENNVRTLYLATLTILNRSYLKMHQKKVEIADKTVQILYVMSDARSCHYVIILIQI